MNSKKIDESIKLFQEIKDLDEKILSIERMAKLAANNNIEARLGLGIRDLNKDSTSKSRPEFSQQNFIHQYLEQLKEHIEEQHGKGSVQINHVGSGKIGNNDKKPFIPDEKYESSVSNSTVLKVLALIIEDLKASRVLLIEKVNSINAS